MAQYHLYSADISPFAQRVVLQLDHKGIAFTHEHPPGGFGSAEYGLINPIQKLPVLRVDGVNLPESEVICEYLEQVHPEPALFPEDPMARAKVRLIARIIDLYIMNPMMPLFKNLSRATRDQAVVDHALASIKAGLGHLNHWIEPGRHATGGQTTLADFAAAPVLRYAFQYPPVFGFKDPFADLPNVAAYYAACRENANVDGALSRIEAGWDAMRQAAR
ncbi:glutathione S-transferase [Hephaestia caeni]|uniref:Glutathione S-transferase n=1 Tax=Hephaestia caeni TaxID=645617 RepID=A0A397NK78_9SPHN|nr:glutathione S-transferase family protein [Hephaestia caeni]RIA37962.1 glutathione S-transferase [Hephaestia caeni]